VIFKNVFRARFLLSILLLLLGCEGCSPALNFGPDPNSRPVRCLTIAFKTEQRKEFFGQMGKFAQENGLKYMLSLNGNLFLIEINGDGFDILAGGGNSFAGSPNSGEGFEKIDICFFNETSLPTPQTTVDQLFDDIKAHIVAIPDVKIIDEK